jgi:hypothetical protein
LICLFALKIPYSPNKALFISETVIMVLLLALTLGAQTFISHTFKREHCHAVPLILIQSHDIDGFIAMQEYLPMSLATEKMHERIRKHSKPKSALATGVAGAVGQVTNAVGQVEDEIEDLFNRDRRRYCHPLLSTELIGVASQQEWCQQSGGGSACSRNATQTADTPRTPQSLRSGARRTGHGSARRAIHL